MSSIAIEFGYESAILQDSGDIDMVLLRANLVDGKHLYVFRPMSCSTTCIFHLELSMPETFFIAPFSLFRILVVHIY